METSVNISNDSKFFMILKAAMNVPGVQIRRNDFLRKELSIEFPANVVDMAIEKNPASAGITVTQLEKIAKSCISYETNKVTAISAVAGIPGGFAMIGTVPVDTTQYFAHIIRILQKLIYLYGWKELYNSNGDFDDDTTNQLTLFIGVMFGVNSANSAITKLAQSAAVKGEKSLANKALTKGMIYPIVKKIAEKLGVRMTKEIFAKGVSKIVPVLGGVISGGLTYATFKPSAVRLKNHLKKLPTVDVEFYKTKHKDSIDVDFDEIIDIE
ncbi:hypothetical protein [Clostridium arbusti]|uniref:hypothetical protein n=1 Tax=Clostridium arbusti TaxID=1137848 RepID=UPI000288267E|nr:hypothetical protein [Clostridium arbusti]